MADLQMPSPRNDSGVMDVTPTTPANTALSEQPTPEPPPAEHSHRRPLTVAFAIIATIAIALLAVAVLAYRWNRSTPHSAMIIVWSNEKTDDWDGATAVVSGPNLKGGDLSATIAKKNNLIVRFHVPPGPYQIKIIKDGRIVGEKSHLGLAEKIAWWPFHAPEEVRRRNQQ